MSEPHDRQRLLRDTLAEGGADRREALFSQTLRLVRRRRHFRQARRTVLGLILFVAGAWLFLRQETPAPKPGPVEPHRPYVLVQTQPLAPSAIVFTKSSPHREVPTSSPASVEIVETDPAAHRFRVISDQDLLALAAPGSPVLIRHGPHEAELVFPEGSPD